MSDLRDITDEQIQGVIEKIPDNTLIDSTGKKITGLTVGSVRREMDHLLREGFTLGDVRSAYTISDALLVGAPSQSIPVDELIQRAVENSVARIKSDNTPGGYDQRNRVVPKRGLKRRAPGQEAKDGELRDDEGDA